MPQVLNRRIRVLVAPLAALGALLCIASPLRAQCQIAQDIIRTPNELAAAQKDAIRVFVECATPGLSAPEPLKISQSRTMFIDALRDPQVSVPFRIELGKQLDPILTRLVADKRDMVVINALVIAGELATDQGITIAEKHLKHADPAVRYAAVHAITQTFEAVARTTPAVRDEPLDRAIVALGKQLAAESDPRVIDALARALAAALDIPRTEFSQVRARALSELSLRLGARLKGAAGNPIDPMLLDTAVGCGTTVRNALANAGVQGRLPEQAITDACGLGGDMLATVTRMIRDTAALPPIAAGDEDPAPKIQARVLPSQAVALAETIISLAGVKSPVLDNPAKRLSDMLKTAKPQDDALFLDGVQQLIGRDGAVIKQKGFKPDRFLP